MSKDEIIKNIECLICGGPCTKYSWDKQKYCDKCKQLKDMGHSFAKIRHLRALEDSTLRAKVDNLLPIDVIEAKHILKYDFINTFPNGIIVHHDGDKQTQELLISTYKNFEHYAELEEFPTIMNNVLQMTLQHDSVSKLLNIPTLSNKNIEDIKKILKKPTIDIKDKMEITSILDNSSILSSADRKNYMAVLKEAGEETIKSISALNKIKADRNSNPVNAIADAFRNMVLYHHEHDQEYTAIGICETCQQRIVMKTNFTTFRATYLEYLTEITDKLIEQYPTDKPIIMDMFNMINKKIDDNSLAETYTTEFIRKFTKHLL